jgi:streptogramin lyase
MMKPWHLPLLSLLLGLALSGAALASAASLNIHETDLAGYGEAYEVNLGSDGLLYVSDAVAMQIWKINPSSNAAIQYQLYGPVQDAKPDATGDIWWSGGDETFGRIDLHKAGPLTATLTTWQAPEGHNLWGLTFDAQGHLWMTEWFGAYSYLYRFTPATTELCTYTLPLDGSLPASSYSYYLLHDNGSLWLANWNLRRIYRLHLGSEQATWWQIPIEKSWPVGLALDHQGRLWWADQGLGALASLDADKSWMVTYTLPVGSSPQMLAFQDRLIWYTEEVSATVGVLDLQSAPGITRTLATGTFPASHVCGPDGLTGLDEVINFSPTTLSWSQGSLESAYSDSRWKIFNLPPGGRPYGIARAANKTWVVDQQRKKLIRIPSLESRIYLPLIIR